LMGCLWCCAADEPREKASQVHVRTSSGAETATENVSSFSALKLGQPPPPLDIESPFTGSPTGDQKDAIRAVPAERKKSRLSRGG